MNGEEYFLKSYSCLPYIYQFYEFLLLKRDDLAYWTAKNPEGLDHPYKMPIIS